MLEYLKGKITEINPAGAVLETASGVGFMLNISLNTYAALSAQKDSENSTKLYVYENIREDAWVLYGFCTTEERELFRLLVGVSGVGASTARIILSSLTVSELENVIASSDVKTLKSIKGIGAKTAERIIVDLRDKIKPGPDTLFISEIRQASTHGMAYEDALTALVNLGFTQGAVKKVLDKLFKEQADMRVEVAIKRALSML